MNPEPSVAVHQSLERELHLLQGHKIQALVQTNIFKVVFPSELKKKMLMRRNKKDPHFESEVFNTTKCHY